LAIAELEGAPKFSSVGSEHHHLVCTGVNESDRLSLATVIEPIDVGVGSRHVLDHDFPEGGKVCIVSITSNPEVLRMRIVLLTQRFNVGQIDVRSGSDVLLGIYTTRRLHRLAREWDNRRVSTIGKRCPKPSVPDNDTHRSSCPLTFVTLPSNTQVTRRKQSGGALE
jgi:hypothetical protein